MANLDVIEFECPRCLKKIRVAIEKAGQRIDCPSCQGSLLVPSKTTGQDLFDDIFDSESDASSTSSYVESGTVDKSTDATHRDDLPTDKPDSGLEVETDEDLLRGISTPENESARDDINPLEGDDPFEVDPDAPLKVEGIGDIFGHADVYGIKCNICDTRIHVRPDQAYTHVECPECFSKVLVTPPEKTLKPAQRWVKEGRDKKPKPADDNDELKLSEPVERPKVEIDESYGLEPPSEDLLAPKPKSTRRPGEDYGLEIMEEDEDELASKNPSQPKGPRASPAQPDSTKSKKPAARSTVPASGKSRRELYEEAQRRQQAEEAGIPYQPDEPFDIEATKDFPDVDFGSLFGASIEMLKSPGVLWRVLIAIALMCFGAIAMESIYPASTSTPADDEGGTMMARMIQGASWIIVGGLPYILGLLMLWFTSGYIFRDAALGHRQIESWKNAGTSELTGTFLVFSFGFFIGGLPALFLTWLVMPLRVLLGPLFLLGAWYSREPFAIVNVDAFKNVTKEMWLWGAFYQFMAVLALLGFIGGVMFRLRAIEGTSFAVSVVLTVPAVLIAVAVTLIFAAVCGWHCGRVVEGLEESK